MLSPLSAKQTNAIAHPSTKSRGFALLITITLLAFLVLLLVSLASLTRVETQVASNSQQLAQARQNAIFALNIAIGQLQLAAGPDQRVTATAEVLSNTDPTKKKWTGVWDTRTATIATAPTWLVSQATQAVADAPNNTTPAPTLAATADSSTTAVRLVGSKSADTSTSVPANAGNEVVVPLQDIKSDVFPGAPANTTVGRFGYWVGDEGVKARINLPDPYAGKSDTVSLLNRVDTAQRTAWELFSGPTSPTPATTDPLTVISTAMTEASGRMLSAQQIKLLSSADSSAPAGAADALTKITTARFHDYTLWSAGVQADARNGGLKWDLSTAFDLSDTLYKTSEFSGKAPTQRDPSTNFTISPLAAYSAPGGMVAPTVAFVFLPQVSYNNTTPSYLHGPTWTLLRSHHLLYQTQNPTAAPSPLIARAVYPGGNKSGLGGQDNIPSLYEVNSGYGGGAATDPNTNININGSSPARPVPRPTQTSIAPYINRVFIRFGLKTVSKSVTTSAGTNATVYAVQLVMTPFVVLHNPYDTTVNFHSYSHNSSPGPGATPNIAAQIGLFAATSRGLPLFLRVFVNGYDYMTNCTSNGGVGAGIVSLGGNDYSDAWPRFKLLIPDTISLKPGELKVLYPQTAANGDITISKGPPDTTYVTLNTTPNLQGGFVFSLLNGQRKTQQSDAAYLSAPNNSNPNVNPPLVAAGATIQPNKALTAAEFSTAIAAAGPGSATEIWCTPSDQIQAVINTKSGDFEIKYSIESLDPTTNTTTDNAASSSTDASSMVYQLDGFAPDYKSGGASATGYDAYVAQYTNYSSVPAPGFTRADDYKRPKTPLVASNCTNTKYFFGLDFYVKPADHPAAKAARPFITSNPVAFEQFSTALGGQTSPLSANGTSGFPHIMPAYQIDYDDLDPTTASNLTANMYIDGNGDSIWGPHNGNDGQASSTLDGSSTGLSSVPLIHIPNRPLTSLADLQHANIAFYGYQPYFAVGNSYASPYVPANSYLNPVGYSAPSGGSGADPSKPYFLYDLSYLMNWALSDKYFFSSLSQEYTGGAWGSSDASLVSSIKTWAAGTRTLANSRNVPYNSSRITAVSNLTGASSLQSDYRQVAASMMTLGSFNINSRSVDAWAAVLGAARGLSVVTSNGGTLSTVSIPGGTNPAAATAIPRMLPIAGQSDASTLSAATWNGFTALSDAQIRQFAKNIVAEITRRQNGTTITMTGIASPATISYSGPFRSLADFTNRNLVDDLTNTDPATGGPASTGAKGVLQAALDEPTNALSPNYKFYTGSSYRDVSVAQGDPQWGFKWNSITSNAKAGQGPTTSTALGFILQADVLQQIGPHLSARSDTFVIRTYGESVNPATGASAGKAWCEAVVQRTPEYVDQTDPDLTKTSLTPLGVALYDATPPHSLSVYGVSSDNLSTNNKAFGRRFKIISFRWLSPQDI